MEITNMVQALNALTWQGVVGLFMALVAVLLLTYMLAKY